MRRCVTIEEEEEGLMGEGHRRAGDIPGESKSSVLCLIHENLVPLFKKEDGKYLIFQPIFSPCVYLSCLLLHLTVNVCLPLQGGRGQADGSCHEGLHGDESTGGERSSAGEEHSQTLQGGEDKENRTRRAQTQEWTHRTNKQTSR